jgi:hypothetical protein
MKMRDDTHLLNLDVFHLAASMLYKRYMHRKQLYKGGAPRGFHNVDNNKINWGYRSPVVKAKIQKESEKLIPSQ